MQQFLVAASVATLLSVRGIRKGSLTKSGAISAFIVGFFTLSCGYRFATLLLTFYFTSTKLTKFKAERKNTIDANYTSTGNRSASQVLACSLLGVVISLVYRFSGRNDQPIEFLHDPTAAFLWCCYIGHYACCNGDTWASELGVLSKTQPLLITTLRQVPRGTNGGISVIGTAASAAGGGIIGLSFYLHGLVTFPQAPLQYHAIILGVIAGFLGSMIDSVLGATIQITWYDVESRSIVDGPGVGRKRISGRDWLSNEQVNLISVGLTTILTGFIGQFMLFR